MQSSASRAVLINTTDGSIPIYGGGYSTNLRVAAAEASSPPVLDFLKTPDGTITAGETTGVISFGIDDDSNYTTAEIRVTNHTSAGSGHSGGGCITFFTNPSGLAATTQARVSITHLGHISASNSQVTASALQLLSTPSLSSEDTALVIGSSGNIGRRELSSFVQDGGGAACQVAMWADGNRVSGSNEFIYDTSTGRVGIGSTNPTGSLHVEGPGYFAGGSVDVGDSVSDAAIVINENDFIYNRTGQYLRKIIGTNSSDSITIGQSGTSLIDRIDLFPGTTGGCVRIFDNSTVRAIFTGSRFGLGTTSPERKLSVTDSSIVTTVFRGTNSTGQLIDLRHTNSADGYNGFRFYDEDANRMNLTHIQTGTRGYVQIGNDWAAGSEILVVDGDNERVGIGIATPTERLHVDGKILLSGSCHIQFRSSNAFISEHGSDGLQIRTGDNRDIRLKTNGNNSRLTVKGTGNVGIGTTDPQATLHADYGSTIAPSLTFGATAGQILQNENSEFAFGLHNASPYPLWIQGRNSSNSARNITLQPLGGNIGIGTYSPSSLLDVDGTTTTVTLVETSTKELKEDIQPLDSQLENLKKLKPIEFAWKKDKKKDFGLLAEDVEKVYPYLVEHDEEDKLIGVKYSKLTSVLVKAIQEQQEQIEELKKEIFILKEKL